MPSLFLLLLLAPFLTARESDRFAHRKHAPLKLNCATCHTGVDKQERAGFPTVAQCRSCHPTMPERKIPSQRIYHVKDFVVFSHAVHLTAKAVCADCHGDVFATDNLTLARPTTMLACVECHKQRNATQRCNACHELGQ